MKKTYTITYMDTENEPRGEEASGMYEMWTGETRVHNVKM